MNAFQIIFGILDIIVCVALIIIVMTQSSKTGGLGAIGGQSDAGFGAARAKSHRNEAILTKATIGLSVLFIALSVALFAVSAKKTTTTTATATPTPAATATATPEADPTATPTATPEA
ncbi:MAG: preprotein translocase subunit SecG [Clostridia bacterium]|nr:preprotein translocase subunit SecG [Clostridia bacterium]